MRQYVSYTILSAKAATGAGIAILCKDFRHAIFSFATDGGGTAILTTKFQGAISEGATAGQAPAFGSAQSVTNLWDYIEVVDLQSGSTINGDTGVAITVAGDDYRLLEANINGLDYICARVTVRTAGNVTIKCRLYND